MPLNLCMTEHLLLDTGETPLGDCMARVDGGVQCTHPRMLTGSFTVCLLLTQNEYNSD